MLPFLIFVLASLLLPLRARDAGAQCPSNEQAVRAVAQAYWSAHNRRDAAALDTVFDEQFLLVTENGAVSSKAEALAYYRTPLGNMTSQSAEFPEDVRIRFAGNTAVMNFTKRFTLTHKQASAVSIGETSRMSEVFICRSGQWKLLLFQETVIPNYTRQPYAPAVAGLDDYIGTYAFGERGDRGTITVTRKGSSLLEAWGTDHPAELLPGRYDSFFSRGLAMIERFVRDGSGKVVGIHYTWPDGDMEAKRVR